MSPACANVLPARGTVFVLHKLKASYFLKVGQQRPVRVEKFHSQLESPHADKYFSFCVHVNLALFHRIPILSIKKCQISNLDKNLENNLHIHVCIYIYIHTHIYFFPCMKGKYPCINQWLAGKCNSEDPCLLPSVSKKKLK